MRNLMFTGVFLAAVAFALGNVMAATNVTDIYPGSFAGWGIPGPPPHGNGGGWSFGTTTRPTFVDGSSSGTKAPSPGDGRGSVWWGNDGGTGDALIGSSEAAGPGATNLYDGVLLSTLESFSMVHWRNSTSPVGGAVHPYVNTALIFWMRDSAGGASKFARVEPRWIAYGKDQTTYAAAATYMANANDQWYDWTFDRTEQVLEFTGNVPGTSFASDAWDGTGSPNGKLVSLNQLATAFPNLQFSNTGWPNSQSIEVTNNIFGNRHDTWFDTMTFTWAGSSAPVTGADGDANGDGVVNILDLSILSGNWQATTGAGPSAGDFNSDGTVNILDLSIMSGNWQATSVGAPGDTDVYNFTTSSGGSSAEASLGGVPEPGTMLLLAAGAGLMLVRRRRA